MHPGLAREQPLVFLCSSKGLKQGQSRGIHVPKQMANQKHHSPCLIGYVTPSLVELRRIETLLQLQKRKRKAGMEVTVLMVMSMTLPMAHLKSGQCLGNHNLGANGGWATTTRTGGKGYCIVVRGKKNEDTFHFIAIKH